MKPFRFVVVMKNKIYTIGYGNRNLENFVKVLKELQIDYLIDVRSIPYSKYNTDFTKANLEQNLKTFEIGYAYFGKELGGIPESDEFKTDGKTNYKKITESASFQKGIQRLKTALEKDFNVILMCAELKPENCHRTKLIGKELTLKNISVIHIDEKLNEISQKEAEKRNENPQINLF